MSLGLYVDFSFPVELMQFLTKLLSGQQHNPNTPQVTQTTGPRQWFSQPRPGTDPTTEVITGRFKLPLSVSEITFTALRVPAHFEVWYQDRSNNWRQVLDASRIPVTLDLSGSDVIDWYTFHTSVYPIVAKALQIRATRKPDDLLGSQSYVIGLSNILPRRNVYDRSSGTQAFAADQDPVGNVIEKTIKDWDPGRAIDDNATTFWKSAAMPDPSAVVCCYASIRDKITGEAKTFSRLFIDPVHTGNWLNLYYSNDDTVGVRKLSPISVIPPDDPDHPHDFNTDWTLGTGRRDISVGATGRGHYEWAVSMGSYHDQDMWVGIEWAPDFDPNAAPAQNPVLFRTVPGGVDIDTPVRTAGVYAPTIRYDVGSGEIQLVLDDGTAPHTYSAALTGAFAVAGGVDKGAVRAAVFDNITLSAPGATLDGLTAANGDVFLLLGQLTSTQNGPYLYNGAASPMTRMPNWDTTGEAVPGSYWEVLAGTSAGRYAAMINASFTLGSDALQVVFHDAMPVRANKPLRILVGWRYGVDGNPTLTPDQVMILVKDTDGNTVASSITDTALPPTVSLDGLMGFDRFRGLMTALIVKAESYIGRSDPFTANPQVYVNPDPVIPDLNGVVPSTSLDNALFAADWTAQQNPTGGPDDTHYADKEWTPIWKDYTTERGTLYLPQTITAKYLKLELTNLTAEAYPIYDSGISVQYKVFPVSVAQQSRMGPQVYTQPGGFLGLGDIISINGVRSINFLNPFSILDATQAIFGNTVTPVQIQVSPGQVTSTQPQASGITAASSTYGIELGNTYIYRRDALNPYILAQDQYNTTIKAEGLQSISAYTDVPWQTIEASNPGAIQHNPSPGALPIRGTDWWIFPGQTLKLPAAVMTQLTSGETVTDFHADLTHRVRFTTTSVHRYETRTVTRDKAIAYFAGIREIQPYSTAYVVGQDADYFEFTDYSQWTAINTVQIDEGPVSTAGSPYVVPGGSFPASLDHWEELAGSWNWVSGQNSALGVNEGAAHVRLSGSDVELASEIIPVTAGDQITVSAWVRWAGITGTSPTIGIELIPVSGTTEAGRQALGGSFAVLPNDATPTVVGTLDGFYYVQVQGTWTIPASGTDGVRIVAFGRDIDAGQLWFTRFDMLDADMGDGTLGKSFQTTGAFNFVQCDFRDSGLVRSDPMWADIDPADDTNIPNDLLSPYVEPMPGTIPRGFWADSFATWADPDVTWGEPHAVVSVNIDGTRVYQGKRTLHFTRDADQGQAGVKVRQWTHFFPGTSARIGAVFYKGTPNANEIGVLLRRVSDGVPIYEETITNPPTGFWYEYQSPFFDVPDNLDQVYSLEFTLSGDQADDIYLSDLYSEIANIRYQVLLGPLGPDNPYIDVTDLRYSGQETYVSSPVPVTQMSVQVKILSREAWALGARLTPNYLRT
jgi:hypothetical protein